MLVRFLGQLETEPNNSKFEVTIHGSGGDGKDTAGSPERKTIGSGQGGKLEC